MEATIQPGRPLTGSVTLTNTKPYPFNDSEVTIVLDTMLESGDYIVHTAATGALGETGDIIVSDKTKNGFKLSYTGSAIQAVIRYAVKGVTAIAGKNTKTCVAISNTGSMVRFRDGALSVDVSLFQQNYPVSMEISIDESGALVTGPADRYVAQLQIPPRSYVIEAGATDDFGFAKLKKTPVPLNMDMVTVTLWAWEV